MQWSFLTWNHPLYIAQLNPLTDRAVTFFVCYWILTCMLYLKLRCQFLFSKDVFSSKQDKTCCLNFVECLEAGSLFFFQVLEY